MLRNGFHHRALEIEFVELSQVYPIRRVQRPFGTGRAELTLYNVGGPVHEDPLMPVTAKLSKKFYSSTEQADIAIQLPGWKYPVVINDGKASYDNYNGSWGKQSTFDKMKQNYSTQVATKKARNMGYMVKETAQADGTVRLTLSR